MDGQEGHMLRLGKKYGAIGNTPLFQNECVYK